MSSSFIKFPNVFFTLADTESGAYRQLPGVSTSGELNLRIGHIKPNMEAALKSSDRNPQHQASRQPVRLLQNKLSGITVLICRPYIAIHWEWKVASPRLPRNVGGRMLYMRDIIGAPPRAPP